MLWVFFPFFPNVLRRDVIIPFESSFDPGERLQAPVSLWFSFISELPF
jgi:hypothetical protein